MRTLWSGLTLVSRRLRKSPGFTAAVLLTLALGIGANTAIFSVINTILIRPLPFPEPDRLVGLWHVAPGVTGLNAEQKINLGPTNYFTYRELNQTFEDMGVWDTSGATVTGVGEPERIQTLMITAGLLNTLGVQPTLGRPFSQADDSPGTPETVILTYGYWQRRFGGDPNILGRNVTVDSTPHQVIGVMGREFRFLNQEVDTILPFRFDRNKIFLGNFSYQGIARLKPGATLEQANADIARMIPLWLDAWPMFPGVDKKLMEQARLGPSLQPLKEEVVGDVGKTLWVLMATLSLVLLIACANVANLLLVRVEGRQQELAIRAALGAGWGRIARDLLAESLVLALLGGALGLGLAYGGIRLLAAYGPGDLPRIGELSIDLNVLLFALGVSLLTGLLFGLIPVLKYAAPHIATSLRSGGRNSSEGRERHRARNTLVVVQVAMALILLISSGLMIRTFQALREVRPGFTDPQNIQTVRLTIPEAQIPQGELVVRMQNQILDRLAAIPGVDSVSFGSTAPMGNSQNNDLLSAEDHNYKPDELPPVRRFYKVAPGYFATLGTRLVAGRDLTWTDLYDGRNVAMVSESLARENWGSPQAAIGKRIRAVNTDPWREVVAVVEDVHDDGVDQAAPRAAYWPARMQHFEGDDLAIQRSAVFVIRSRRAGTATFLTDVRKAVWSVNNSLPLAVVRTLDESYRASMARTSFTLVMLAIAGGMALVLGVIGIYGVIAYAVTQRTREIGIRLALGAQTGELKRMFVRQAVILAAIGVGIGLLGAAGLSRWLKSLLYEVSPLDPLTYGLVPVALLIAALVASYLPARRVTAVDPMESLRSE